MSVKVLLAPSGWPNLVTPGGPLTVAVPEMLVQVTNLALDPAGTAHSTGGLGRFGTDRWSGNVTYSLGTDGGPLDGVDTYTRLTVVTGRSKLGHHFASNPESAVPVTSRMFPVTAGQTIRLKVYTRASAASQRAIYVRGATAGGAWVDAAPIATGAEFGGIGSWKKHTGTYVVPAGVAWLAAAVWCPTTLAAGVTLDATAIMVKVGVTEYDYFDGSFPGAAWAGTPHASQSTGVPIETQPTGPVVFPVPPNLPAGYGLHKVIDFADASEWQVRDGNVKAQGIMNPDYVHFGQGENNDELRLRGGRETPGGQVWGSEVRGSISQQWAIPNFSFRWMRFSYDGPQGGRWPALWERGLSNTDGEIDHFEMFGNTAHAALHATPYTSGVHRSINGGNFPGAGSDPAGQEHMIETLVTPESIKIWYDGELIDVLTAAQFDDNSYMPGAPGRLLGSAKWSPQFDSPAKTWFPIVSNQWNNAYSGGISDDPFEWNLYVKPWEIYTPA